MITIIIIINETQVLKMTNDLVAPVQNLSQRVNILEKEKGAAESALMAATESNKKAMG